MKAPRETTGCRTGRLTTLSCVGTLPTAVRLALLSLLLASVHTARAQDVRLTVAAFTTPEATAAAQADGTTIEARVADAFAAWQAVLDSATTGSARVVAVPSRLFSIAITETGDCLADRDAFFASARAHAVRDSLRANLAVLFAERCSQTFLCDPAAPGGLAACERNAFALAQARFAGASRQTLAHEVGHLLSMRHNVEDDDAPGDGHAMLNVAAGFYTVVSTRGGLPREALVPYYSDPRRSLRGAPLGIAGRADNAAVLRRMAPVAAMWNSRPTATAGGPQAETETRVAPNPSSSVWHVTLRAAPRARTAVLVDALGRRVAVVEIAAGEQDVVVSTLGLAPGVYALLVAGGPAVRLVRAR